MKTTKRVLIIDDERLARVALKALLQEFSSVEIIGEAADADSGVALIEELKPDLIFLDIQMPEQSGFDLLERLDVDVMVIFTTAYDAYALQAFEFNALDYLLKPIERKRLTEALDRVEKSLYITKQQEQESECAVQPYGEHIYLKDGEQHHFVAFRDISLFASYGNYVRVFFKEKSLLVHRSLNQIEQRLSDEAFFRANRYAIINTQHIVALSQVEKAKLSVRLKTEHRIVLSERKSVAFRNRWSV